MSEKYVVWFEGTSEELPGLCYEGRAVFYTTQLEAARDLAKELVEWNELTPEHFKACKLVEVPND